MPVIRCYVDDETMRILEAASTDLGREVDQLAEAAISEAAIRYKVDRMPAIPPHVREAVARKIRRDAQARASFPCSTTYGALKWK
ncbi:hypothetical protein IQ17_03299 [Bradyrhizobium daqingense]|uniref:Uncharacterized protein n=1 Tax=Bradyrhizobium daqingense TaxID=993502 RepID=A0A562LCG6_9BRAD|nr:hypothetical protein IQ17_03299 [Bradyrhizobium daqingense]